MQDVSQERQSMARQLREAYRGSAIPPLRIQASQTSQEAAYQIQKHNTQHWIANGSKVVGCKIGLTSEAVQAQLGVNQPDFGMLFEENAFSSGETIAIDDFLAPQVEAEVAFMLKADLTKPNLQVADVIAAVDYTVAALEVVDSRIANWDISLFDTIADNASYGAHVIGTDHVDIAELDLKQCQMELMEDGVAVSKGQGSDCLGDPLNAVLWLAGVMRDTGRPLLAGDLVLSGALGPMTPLNPGKTYVATIGGLGPVSVSSSKSERASAEGSQH